MYFSPSRNIVTYPDGRFMKIKEPEWDVEGFKTVVSGMLPMKSYLIYENFLSGVDQLLRYENLADDFTMMCQILGLPLDGSRLPILNVSSDTSGRREELRNDVKLRSWVEEFFIEDMELFGYW